ncbi:MAG: carbonic anhydrase [Desulfarculus sp.]|nr:carbonic anhydrase [Desulfarculus sp.]
MKRVLMPCLVLLLCLGLALPALASDAPAGKPSPDQVLQMLKDGNARYMAGKSTGEHRDPARMKLSGESDQGKYAYCTILSCSDSRVPAELIFDAGIMDVFVVRVAGNVAKTDEIGTIEYGLAHVHTPVLVVMGHTGCGAVNAVIAEMEGHGHELERNIPPLVAPIVPAVKRAQSKHPEKKGKELAPLAIEENVWQAISNLFMASPATRNLVKEHKVKVVGAMYDLSSGKVTFLPEAKVGQILTRVEASPKKATNVMYEKPAAKN